jgi:hypothetical protein
VQILPPRQAFSGSLKRALSYYGVNVPVIGKITKRYWAEIKIPGKE